MKKKNKVLKRLDYEIEKVKNDIRFNSIKKNKLLSLREEVIGRIKKDIDEIKIPSDKPKKTKRNYFDGEVVKERQNCLVSPDKKSKR